MIQDNELYRKHDDLTPSQYLALTPAERDNIAGTTIIPPKLGNEADFGKIRVFYRFPMLNVCLKQY